MKVIVTIQVEDASDQQDLIDYLQSSIPYWGDATVLAELSDLNDIEYRVNDRVIEID